MEAAGESIPEWRAARARVAPFALFVTLLALQPWLVREGVADPRWIAIARDLAAGALLCWYGREYREIWRAAPLSPREWLASVAVGGAVFAAWIGLDQGWAVVGGESPGFVPLDAKGAVDPVLAALRLAGLALVVPVMEELFWRSFAMRWLDGRDFLARDPRRASFRALVLTAVLFASEHSLWLAGLVAGVAYGAIYARTGNLKASILSHATTNGILGLWILATGQWRLW